jgi:hypothetical protein
MAESVMAESVMAESVMARHSPSKCIRASTPVFAGYA